MKIHGAIFSTPMVQALLAGMKTQTRRLAWIVTKGRASTSYKPSTWQKLKPGDLIYVREELTRSGAYARYVADGKQAYGMDSAGMLKPMMWPADWTRDPASAMHMPRTFNRLTLEVTENRIERLQSISNADARAEGMDQLGKVPQSFPVEAYKDIWIRLHGVDSWDDNPDVCAVTFLVHTMNVDYFLESKSTSRAANAFAEGVREGKVVGFTMDEREGMWPENLAGVEHLGKGRLVRFTGFNGGEADQEFARRLLTVDAWYTLMDVDIRSWSTDIFLAEHAGIGFNSVMFSHRHKRSCDCGICIDRGRMGS